MAQREANPADSTNLVPPAERKRIPMSVPVSKLSVPAIPGWHLHWFNGEPARIQRAIQGGYKFVTEDDIGALGSRILGSAPLESGNTDMGTRVSQVAGDEIGRDGQPVRLYLMKIEEEEWLKDQAALTAPGSRIDNVRNSLLSGTVGSDRQTKEDQANTYLDPKRTKLPDFLTRKS